MSHSAVLKYLEAKREDPIFGDTTGNIDITELVSGLHERGVTESSKIFELIRDHYNAYQEYPRSLEDLRDACSFAERFDPTPFDPLARPTHTKTGGKTLPLEFFENISPDLARSALVKGMLAKGTMSVVFGDSNKGKTFLALNLAFSVALGKEFCGKRVTQGGVLYVSAEGADSVRKRVAAIRKYLNLENTNVPFALIPKAIDLRDATQDTQGLIEAVNVAATKWGGSVVLVIVDTLARVIAGGNENAADDMSAFIRNVDRIREETGAHVLVIHHSGKDQTKGARGHSSLRAATDTEIEVSDGQARATKQRDMELGGPVYFRLETVEIGIDENGDAVYSAVMIPTNSPASEFQRPPLKDGSNEAKAFEALKIATQEYGQPALESADTLFIDSPIVTEDLWRKTFAERFFAPDAKRSSVSSAFTRSAEKLYASQRIVRIGDCVGIHA